MVVCLNTLKRLVREVVEERTIGSTVKDIDDVATYEPWVLEKLLKIRTFVNDISTTDVRGIVQKLRDDDAEMHELPDGKLLLRIGGDEDRANYVFDWATRMWNEIHDLVGELGAV
jgi:hypothetical protein